MNVLQRLLLKRVRNMARRQANQEFFERLLAQAHRGMNVGGGGSVEASGEHQVFSLVEQCGRNGIVVFDVGANIGDYARAARAHLGTNARIYSFEPSPRVFATLKQAVASVSVEAFNIGLGNAKGVSTLHFDPEAMSLSSLYRRDLAHVGRELEESEDVAIERLDAFCQANGIDYISLLKLDVEGHELKVLEGAGEYLAGGAIHMIQFEFGGCNVDSRTYVRDFHALLSPQYDLYRVLARGFRKIESYDPTLEIFTTTNYLACLRGLDVSVPLAE